MTHKILLVGTGYIAAEYVKVFKILGLDYDIAGHTLNSVEKFNSTYNENAVPNGVNILLGGDYKYDYAIVAVSGNALYEVTAKLISAGIKNVLIEKPGTLTKNELINLIGDANKKNTRVLIGYNRRFYPSVLTAEKIIAEDGGITSVNFEFTEWSHLIENDLHSVDIKQKWFLMNSSHVVDLVFYFAGMPEKIYALNAGALHWHDSSSRFAGCGVTKRGIMFSYNANWEAPGRWSVEILTNKHRLYLRPMEQLYIQERGSVLLNEIFLEKEPKEKECKEGLYKEVECFINKTDDGRFCSLQEQLSAMDIYEMISGEKY
ncbi:MAG: Gfo/Idh/MocA family oxidoreductase [Lachnospiraceae bacterium]|nr:Gfo/Idh/MocA family oxidoreductase [Lachnospiraceae bacterium]